MPTSSSIPTLVFVHARLDSTTFLKDHHQDHWSASHVWPNFVVLVLPPTLLNVQLVLLVLPLDQIMSVIVSQDIMNQMVLVKFVQPSVTDVKLMESAVHVLTQPTENLIKTVLVQLVSLMMVQPHARHAILFVRLVPTQQLVPHALLKTTEPLSMDNVSVLQDFIKLLTLTTLLPVKNVALNVKNVQDQLSVSTAMPPATESLVMMKSDIKLAFVLQDIPH